MHRIRAFPIAMLIIFTITAVSPVYASGEDVKRQYEQVLNQEMSIMSSLEELEKDMQETEAEVEALERKIQNLESKIVTTENEINKIQKDLDKQTEKLGNKLVAIYEMGDLSYLEVLLTSENFKDFLSRFDYLNYVIQEDQETVAHIASQKEKLSSQKRKLESQKRQLAETKEKCDQKQAVLNQQASSKQRLFSNVLAERQQYEQVLMEMEGGSNYVARMLRGYCSSRQLGTGIFRWPTPGYNAITSPYGMRHHPVVQNYKLHTGIDIGAPAGAMIVAADSGVVVHSGWMGAYGNAVLIDHGNGLATLYAHQSSTLVPRGGKVVKGQPIGRVGSTGWSTGPHLHFEVRVNGNPVNPAGFL